MATKSSKIAVTLQPSLKQKLREYGKENQIKNFSGVILAILDEYFGGSTVGAPTSDSSSSDIWDAIRSLTERLDALETGAATTADQKKPVSKPKLKVSSTRRTGARSKTTATKSPAKRSTAKSTGKTTRTTKSTAKSTKTSKPSKTTTTKAKAGRPSKSSSKAAPAKKSTTRRSATPRKSAKSTKDEWMSTREAFEIYGGKLSWSRFSKLTPEELKERFNLDSDLSRKVRGSRFNQWLKPGK